MKIVFILIILAVILLSVAIVVFFWAVKQRQFDDLEVHAYSILKEDDYDLLTTDLTIDQSSGQRREPSSDLYSDTNTEQKTKFNTSNVIELYPVNNK